MELYSKSGKLTTFNNLVYLNEGNCAKVYRYNDYLFKIYNDDCNYHLKIKKEIFMILRDLNAPSIVKLREYFSYRKFSLSKRPDAYTMDILPSSKKKLIYCDKTYLENTFYDLEQTIKLLDKLNIIIDDIHSKNVLFTEQGIYLIDPDLFRKKTIFDSVSAYRINKAILIAYFNAVLYNEMIKERGLFIHPTIENDINNSFFDDVMKSLTEDTFYEVMLKKDKTKRL